MPLANFIPIYLSRPEGIHKMITYLLIPLLNDNNFSAQIESEFVVRLFISSEESRGYILNNMQIITRAACSGNGGPSSNILSRFPCLMLISLLSSCLMSTGMTHIINMQPFPHRFVVGCDLTVCSVRLRLHP